jgi:hypothetical protein
MAKKVLYLMYINPNGVDRAKEQEVSSVLISNHLHPNVVEKKRTDNSTTFLIKIDSSSNSIDDTVRKLELEHGGSGVKVVVKAKYILS